MNLIHVALALLAPSTLTQSSNSQALIFTMPPPTPQTTEIAHSISQHLNKYPNHIISQPNEEFDGTEELYLFRRDGTFADQQTTEKLSYFALLPARLCPTLPDSPDKSFMRFPTLHCSALYIWSSNGFTRVRSRETAHAQEGDSIQLGSISIPRFYLRRGDDGMFDLSSE